MGRHSVSSVFAAAPSRTFLGETYFLFLKLKVSGSENKITTAWFGVWCLVDSDLVSVKGNEV